MGLKLGTWKGKGEGSGCIGKSKKCFDSLALGNTGTCPVDVRAAGRLTWIGLNVLYGKSAVGASTSLLCVVEGHLSQRWHCLSSSCDVSLSSPLYSLHHIKTSKVPPNKQKTKRGYSTILRQVLLGMRWNLLFWPLQLHSTLREMLRAKPPKPVRLPAPGRALLGRFLNLSVPVSPSGRRGRVWL